MKDRDRLSRLVERVRQRTFSGFPLEVSRDGTVTGSFMKMRLASRFADHGEAGGLAFAACRDAAGEPFGEVALYRLAATQGNRAALDRFLRTLHLLNHVALGEPWERLGLPVSEALLAEVEDHHGRAFRSILDDLGLPPDRYVIVLPDSLAGDAGRLQFVRRNYLSHGFTTRLASAYSAPCAATCAR
ncbi:hypothetical protein [Paludibacterium paludis]|uniref:Uncharacterized protein n=1 Tax=Paludibacterium paludis TaxID=1225769 RepID=A0A918UAM3_9NEIS|nr:hypothetical protein [Paludibacterium paludis]GGY17665.1 hypothetical protein GCM10011289_21460 [Paludibacterium paludis]